MNADIDEVSDNHEGMQKKIIQSIEPVLNLANIDDNMHTYTAHAHVVHTH